MKNIGFLSHLDLNLYLFRAPIIRKLINMGHNVYAICPKGDKNNELEQLGCKVVNYHIDRKSLNPFNEKIAINNIYNVIKDLNLDLLHTFTAKPNIYGTLAAKKANVPIVLNLVEGLGSFYTKNSFKNIIVRTILEKLYKKTFSMSDGTVFVNSDDPKYMLNKGLIQKNKIKIIKSVGVDSKKFCIDNFTSLEIDIYRNNLEIDKNTIVILMIARAIWDKGIKEYYESAHILNRTYANIKFILVGDIDRGNHTSVPEEYLKHNNVLWLGHRDDITNIISICDIFVLPSYREGLPVTLMEAASMSKPIVTTDTIGCREVVDSGYNGFLVPIKSSSALSKKIELLINDKDLRYNMGINGREKVLKEFDINIVISKYIKYYEKFLKLS